MKNLMRTFSAVLAVVACVVSATATADESMDNLRKNLAAQFKAHNDLPMFYAECSYLYPSKGKIVVTIEMGETSGDFLDMGWNEQNREDMGLGNSGTFTVNPVEVTAMDEGGPGTGRLMTRIIKYLLTTPFTMIHAKDSEIIIRSEPKTDCPLTEDP